MMVGLSGLFAYLLFKEKQIEETECSPVIQFESPGPHIEEEPAPQQEELAAMEEEQLPEESGAPEEAIENESPLMATGLVLPVSETSCGDWNTDSQIPPV
jgi:hypothetical protein